MNYTPTQIEARIKEFYRDMPFNYYSDAEGAQQNLNADVVERSYPDLHQLLLSGEITSVLEIGCGAGWLSNTIASVYGIDVTAVDFTSKAIERAKEVSIALGTQDKVKFLESNLFDFQSPETFDLVVSIGCIPATRDPKQAYEHLQQFVSNGKYLYLGLYHTYGRKVFLDMFHRILEEQGEEAAYQKYKELDSTRIADETHLRSWFRDQVLHPHENQQSLEEVAAWLEEQHFSLMCTSINRFEAIEDIPALFEVEKQYEQISYQANYVDGRYFPGFFTVLAEKNA